MRIEVLIEGRDPEIYPINKAEIIIGSGSRCDIIVDALGISRRHLRIAKSETNYIVTDLGSTNGSFINEDRMVPGREVEFTSFFPIRLGLDVLISLLTVEEGQDVKDLQSRNANRNDITNLHPGTTVIGLGELKKGSTDGLVKKRQSSLRAKKSEEKEDTVSSSRMLLLTMLCVALISGIGYYQYSTNKEAVLEGEATIQTPEAVAAKPAPPPSSPPDPKFLVPAAELFSKERLDALLVDMKCVNPEELALCSAAQLTSQGREGVVQVGMKFVFLISEKDWLEKASLALPAPVDQGVHSQDQDQLYKTALMEFFFERLSAVQAGSFQDKVFYFAFFSEFPDQSFKVSKAFAVTSEGFLRLRESYNQPSRRALRNHGFKAISNIDLFLTYY